MPPVSRREYLERAGAATIAPLLDANGAERTDRADPPPRRGHERAPDRLRVEYEEDPLGLEAERPRLSWECEGDRSRRQTAYRVLVSSSREKLAADVGDKWDSGKVTSSRSAQVQYDGEPLGSGERVFWKVRIWDENDRPSPWSDRARWEMGLLKGSDWEGEWIASPQQSHQDQLEGWPNASRGWRDYTLDVAFTIEEGNFGVAFRARDSYNLYLWEIATGGSQPALRLRVREEGEWRELKEVPVSHAMPPGTEHESHELRIHMNGGEYDTYLDGTLVDRTSDGTHTRGRVGLWVADGARALVDDLRVSALDGEVIFEDDFSSSESEIDYARGEVAGGKLQLDDTGIALLHRFRPYVTPSPLVRRAADLEKRVSEARLYVCGLGHYELYLNGDRVGERVLEPGRTNYEETLLYSTYDVSNALQSGRNVIGVALGRARLGEPTASQWEWTEVPWWSDPQLLLQLEVTYEDGTSRTVTSDDTWRVTDGPTRFDSLFTGEVYDARRERSGWIDRGYDDSAWDHVEVVDSPGGELVSQTIPPVEVVETLEPVEVTEPKPGVYVYDVGQMIAGWAELTVDGRRGEDVTVTMGEKLDDDGTVHPLEPDYVSGRMQFDTYVLDGDGTETWTPRFTYQGFRYVQLEGEGVPDAPSLDAIEAEVVHTAVEEDVSSDFACSNDLLTQVHENTQWAILNNLHSVHSDTPSYEMQGWTGDDLTVMEAEIYNFWMPQFYHKRLRDISDALERAPDEHGTEGVVPAVIPTSGWGYQDLYTPDPGWQSSCILQPWWTYLYYGDERVLEEQYEGMQQFMAYLASTTDDHIVHDGLGDWVAPWAGRAAVDGEIPGKGDHCPVDTPLGPACTRDGPWVPPEGPAIVSTAWYYRDAQVMARVAEILGREDDAEEFSTLAAAIEEAFNDAFFYPEEGVYRTQGTGPVDVFSEVVAETDNPAPYPQYRQTSNVFPLAFDMVPEGHEEAVVDNLVFDVVVTHDGHLNTGFHGTNYLLEVLSDHGYPDVAYAVATQRTYPSWGWWLENDVTALLETWSLEARSRDHDFLGSIDRWFYKYLAGIREPAEPGFEHIEIAPSIVDDLEWAEATTETIRGEVASRWEQTAEGLTLEVTVPGAAAGTVRIPDLGADAVRVTEGDATIWERGRPDEPFPAGIDDVYRTDGAVVVEVGAGTYDLTLVPEGVHAVGSRADDGAVVGAGQTNRVELQVDANAPVRVRDRLPDGWRVVGGDAHEVYRDEGQQYVEFSGKRRGGEDTYAAEAPETVDGTDQYTFGPIEVNGGDGWRPVSGTADSIAVDADPDL